MEVWRSENVWEHRAEKVAVVVKHDVTKIFKFEMDCLGEVAVWQQTFSTELFSEVLWEDAWGTDEKAVMLSFWDFRRINQISNEHLWATS